MAVEISGENDLRGAPGIARQLDHVRFMRQLSVMNGRPQPACREETFRPQLMSGTSLGGIDAQLIFRLCRSFHTAYIYMYLDFAQSGILKTTISH